MLAKLYPGCFDLKAFGRKREEEVVKCAKLETTAALSISAIPVTHLLTVRAIVLVNSLSPRGH